MGLINQSSQGTGLENQQSAALARALQGKGVQGVDWSLGKASFNLDPAVTNEYFNQSVRQPALQAFDRDIAPRINDAFAGSGMTFSTRRGDATARALGDLNQNLVSERSKLAYQDQALNAQLYESAAQRKMGLTGMEIGMNEAAAQRALQAIPMVTELGNQGLFKAGAISQLLSPFQGRQDAQAEAAYKEFLRTAPENSPYTQQALAFLGTPMTAQYTQPGWGGALTGLLGGALGGGLLGGAGLLGSNIGWGSGAAIGGAFGGLGGLRF